MRPPADAMSGVHWCPVGTASSVVAGVAQLMPSGELRTKTLPCPLGSLAPYTTCTPLASAATAEALSKRENVKPLGQANGPSPQSTPPVPPVNGSGLSGVHHATQRATPKVRPPSVDLTIQNASAVWPWMA